MRKILITSVIAILVMAFVLPAGAAYAGPVKLAPAATVSPPSSALVSGMTADCSITATRGAPATNLQQGATSTPETMFTMAQSAIRSTQDVQAFSPPTLVETAMTCSGDNYTPRDAASLAAQRAPCITGSAQPEIVAGASITL